MCRSLAAENHVGFRYEVGNNGDFVTPRHAASAGEGGQDLLESTPLREGGSSGSSHGFFFDNKLEPWLGGEHGEEEHGGERDRERDEENIIGRTLLYLNEIQVCGSHPVQVEY